MLSKHTVVLLAVYVGTTLGQSLFPSHAFTIRAPEPCDDDCRATICTTEDYCTPCGTGLCLGQEECGTWAGRENHCCIQPYIHGGALRCSEVSNFLSNLDVNATSNEKATVMTAERCPSGQVIASQSPFGGNGGNLTCCAGGKDAVIVESGTLSVPETVICVDELKGGSGSSSSGATRVGFSYTVGVLLLSVLACIH
ncbi:hypothetical protein TWF696_003294 [Orbilia brochopaga]|uniref:Uncharacterized protein n=1 Tax=Orbilia brochopaga TaxID=3140254 RepID=A0AAV9U0L1_9PEZI